MNTTPSDIPRSRRSSTHRSIRHGSSSGAAGPSKQPTWRTSIQAATAKVSAPSISIVFAEPEKVVPPPVQTRGTRLVVPGLSSRSVTEEEEEEAPRTPTTPTRPLRSNPSLPNLRRGPSSSSASTSTVVASPWFASVGRTKGKEKVVLPPQPETQTELVPEPDVVEAEAIVEALPPSPPAPETTTDVVMPVCQSPEASPTREEPTPVPDAQPEPEPIPTHTSLSSSIDDAVPPLPATPPVHEQTRPVALAPALESSTSSSRYMISIPFLGRAKLPLDAIIKADEDRNSTSITAAPTAAPPQPADDDEHDNDNDGSESSDDTPDMAEFDRLPEYPSASMPAPQVDTPPAWDTPPTSTDAKTQTTTSTSTSWWGLVAWSTSTSSAEPLTPTAPAPDDAPPPPLSPTSPTTTTTTAAAAAAAEPAPDTDMPPPMKSLVPSAPPSPPDAQTQDLHVPRSETTATQQPQSWLTTPWSWYTTSTTTTTTTPAPASDAQPIEETKFSDSPPDDSDPPPPFPSSEHEHEPPSTPPPPPETNPIQASIQEHKSSWASFFTSKALSMKTLTYPARAQIDNVKRDENGVEVMDIDEDELEEAADALSTPPNANGNGNGRTKPVSVPGTPTRRKVHNALSNTRSTVSTPLNRSGANTPVHAPGSPSTSVSSRTVVGPGTTAGAAAAVGQGHGQLAPQNQNQNQNQPPTTPSKTPTTPSSSTKRPASPAPSTTSTSGKKQPGPPPPPNLVLPTWDNIFNTAPRNVPPPRPRSYADDQGVGGSTAGGAKMILGRTMKFVSGFLGGAAEGDQSSTNSAARRRKGKQTQRLGHGLGASRLDEEVHDLRGEEEGGGSVLERHLREVLRDFGKELPKAWSVVDGETDMSMGPGLLSRQASSSSLETGGIPKDVLRGCKRVVIVGVHGWFPGAMIRTVLGEPTGTSAKFVNMMETALRDFEREQGVVFEKVTKIPLEGEGVIQKRVEKLYANLLANAEWVEDLHCADAILVATHSQGSVVSTHLLDRLVRDGHIVTRLRVPSSSFTTPTTPSSTTATGDVSFSMSMGGGGMDPGAGMLVERKKVQRVCCLALCGIHLGPLRYLSSSTLVGPYLQYFESMAARELFEFQNTESPASKAYTKVLENVLDHGIKMLYIASLNDQVVPIYSGLFTAVSHPLILRALYIDGDAYHSSDFLSNLLVLLIRILNSGLPDSGLITHLSEATAGSLNGIGHSTAYEELSTYALAVRYLFMANEGDTEGSKLVVEPFNASHEQNDYEIPWSLRDVIADERVAFYLHDEITRLRDAFREWHPRTSILRDLKRKLQPIQKLPSSFSMRSSVATSSTTVSKLPNSKL